LFIHQYFIDRIRQNCTVKWRLYLGITMREKFALYNTTVGHFCCRRERVWPVSKTVRRERCLLQHSRLLSMSLFSRLLRRRSHLPQYVTILHAVSCHACKLEPWIFISLIFLTKNWRMVYDDNDDWNGCTIILKNRLHSQLQDTFFRVSTVNYW